MENYEVKEVIEAAQNAGEQVTKCAGHGAGKYIGVVGAIAAVVAGVYGIVKFTKSKTGKGDLVINPEATDNSDNIDEDDAE